jgi:hypothetical protein
MSNTKKRKEPFDDTTKTFSRYQTPFGNAVQKFHFKKNATKTREIEFPPLRTQTEFGYAI